LLRMALRRGRAPRNPQAVRLRRMLTERQFLTAYVMAWIAALAATYPVGLALGSEAGWIALSVVNGLALAFNFFSLLSYPYGRNLPWCR
jgi:hypothetical protein